MAANISIDCPTCGESFGLRFDPGPEDDAPTLAKAELMTECPNHQNKSWNFWSKIDYS